MSVSAHRTARQYSEGRVRGTEGGDGGTSLKLSSRGGWGVLLVVFQVVLRHVLTLWFGSELWLARAPASR